MAGWSDRPTDWGRAGHPSQDHEYELVGDQIAALTAAGWTSYTPVWTASTPPAIGNGQLTGRYRMVPGTDIVFFIVQITMGSTTTYGTGAWSVGFPTGTPAPSSAGYSECVAHGTAYDSSGGGITPLTTRTASNLMTPNCSSTVPFTWATNDTLTLNGFYQRA